MTADAPLPPVTSSAAPAGVTGGILSVGRFPLGLAIGVIAFTGIALALAAGNVRWGAGAQQPPGDALEPAWIYVNIALAWCWLVLWPITALWKNPRQLAPARIIRRRTRAVLELAVIVVCAIPCAGCAAALNWPGLQMVSQTCAVQGAAALLAMGALTWRNRPLGELLAALLPILGLAGPLAAYIAWEFYPAANSAWTAFIPPIAVYQAATGHADDLFRWMVLAYSALGGALWAAGPLGAPQR